MSYAKTTIYGRLGRDPETRTTQGGKQVCTLSVATDDKRGGESKTTWWRVSVWGKQAEIAERYLAKGRQVIITGRPSLEEWTGKDGAPKAALALSCDDLVLVSDGQRQDQPVPARATVPHGSEWAAQGEARDTGQAWASAERTRVQPAPRQGNLADDGGGKGNPYNDDNIPF